MLLFFGRNVLESVQTGETKRIMEALSKGAKLVYVDPRFSKTSAKADWWLPIKPGTDLALILALINVIITEELYDKDFVEKNTEGFDKLKEFIKQYTPEWAEKECEIPASTIVEIAREMGRRKPAVIAHPGRRTSRYGYDVQMVRGVAILNALMGNYGRPGGIFIKKTRKIKLKRFPTPRYPRVKYKRVDGAGIEDGFPLAKGGVEGLVNRAVEATATGKPYPIKAWFVYGTNLFMNTPNYQLVKSAIKNLDLLVTVEIQPTELVMYSDIVLPEATYLERHQDPQRDSYPYPFVAINTPAVKPLHDTKPGWWICKELAKRLGLEDYFDFETIEEYLDYRLRALPPEAKEDLEKKGVYVKKVNVYLDPEEELFLDTFSGKIELYSSQLEDYGFDPLPVYKKPKEPPKGKYRLIMARPSMHTHARTQNNLWLHELMPENKLWINEEEAKKLGIKDGDTVEVTNEKGISVKIKAYPTNRIRKDVVFMYHGFGRFNPMMRTAYGKGASDAEIVIPDMDPISGTSALHNTFVTVRKVKG